MSKGKDKEKEENKNTVEEKIDLLENILASETDIDLLAKVDELNTQYFQTLENLKEARPVFANCDEAFTSVAEKLLKNFELAYGLLEAQYRGEIERRIAFLEAVNDRIVPFRWRTRILHRYKQNYAATLVDMEADEVMKKVFAKKEREIAEKYYKEEPPQDQNASGEEDFEIIGGLGEEPAEEAESAPQGAEQAEVGEEAAPAQESAQSAESAPQATYEEAVKKAAKKLFAKVENAEKKEKGEKAPAEGSKTASESDSEREGDKNDGEKVEVLAEKAPESVSETVQEGKNPPKSHRKKSKKEEGENDRQSNSA